ncbi:MAG: GDSL-type esterase/lipase family protein [Gemmatimonadetes bacterium]|nr:GDSL-type esterase/lipase family protein [Gemmatimonadota bacterium]
MTAASGRARCTAALLPLLTLAACADRPVEFRQDDHIVIIGNGLADRMQHDGWLETLLQAELPDLRLVIRNQGFTGDRIDHRPREEGFPSADDYLTLSQADVIFAMFGYNESYDDDAARFGAAVAEWIDHTLVQNYSGKGPPRIVLFSPIAHEDLDDPDFPDGTENNARLAEYTRAMEQAARTKSVGFVDLFAPSQALYAETAAPPTHNGVHLNDDGNRRIAEAIVASLLGRRPSAQPEALEHIRAAVLDKNWHWFNRYRPTDGNDVWGSRSTLAFTDGQTNLEVLQPELIQLDSMTANRDAVIRAAAAGKTIKPDDSNVPARIPVVSNLAEPQYQGGISVTGTLDYLGGEEAIGRMTLERGKRANLFASEERFPELVNPVQLGVDTKGRLWVATWATYPKWEPTGPMRDRLIILPDQDRDGVADRAITFAFVHNPTGFEFWNGGVIVASVPDLLYLKDTDGDDVADVRIRILGGLGSADTHHSANSLVYGPDGFIYYQRGIFNVSNVETPWSTNQESDASGMYRFNPRTHEFSFHAENIPNPHGISFDFWGYHYSTDATGGAAYQVRPGGDGTFRMRRLLEHTVRPVPASGILSSAHFPAHNQGNFLILNVIAFLGIKQYTLAYDEATGDVHGTETTDLLGSSDPNFRPTAFEIGDDGALYVADWSNAIIGHMQHNIRDPARDHAHGRIYRITVPGRPLSAHVAIDGQPIPALLEALEHPVNGIRQRARIELSERDTDEVIAATRAWLSRFDPASEADAHHVLEGLWVHQQHNVIDRDLLDLVLQSPVAHARIAARTVEQMWEYGEAARKSRPSPSAGESVAATGAPDADVIVIRTVPDEMRYDTPLFTVRAGQPVQIRFVNDDYAPHNLLIGQPGSTEAIGAAADRLGPRGFAAAFIPESNQILIGSRLLDHRQTEMLAFTAPAVPGDYAVLCTFPGHRQTMNAVMRVVP